MVDIATHRRFVGNVCLYLGVAARLPRPFLQRNLNTVLDAHARQLTDFTTEKPYEAMVANERRSAGWDYPTHEMLQDLVKGQKPVLRIDALQLRLRGVKNSNHWQTAQRSGDHDELEWLPVPSDDLHLPCHVTISVVESSNRRSIYVHSLQGTIAKRQFASDGGHFYDITLCTPFLIELDKLFIATESGVNGSRHWKRTVTTKYTLEVAIKCQDSETTAALLGKLESVDPSNYAERPANEGTLRVVWSNLPQCPASGELLPAKHARGHKSVELKYGMDISMGWARRKDSPLEMYNRERLAIGRQLPTPSASDDQEVVKTNQLAVRYSFKQGEETRAFTQDDLSCIWCQSVAGDNDHGFRDWYDKASVPCKSLNRLRLHYMTCHDHFKMEVGEVVNTEGGQVVPIAIALSEKHSSLTAMDSPAYHPTLEEYSWTAPERPFDISAHVAGDESWVGGGKPKPKRASGRAPKAKEGAELGATAVPVMSRKRAALDEVSDLPTPKRKRFKVPAVPGVTFYHNRSKQKIQPGEELSESDDEMYDDRLARSQQRNLAALGLSKTVCKFHQAFNRHLDAEQSSSKAFIVEALIRFARKHQTELWDDEWRHAFEEKLKHLESHGIISIDIVTACLDRQLSAMDEQHSGEANRAQDSCRANAENPRNDDEGSDLEMSDYEQPRARDNRNLPTRLNGEGTDADPKSKPEQRRLKGRFTSEPSSKGSSPRSKKGHKWSGGGADRDIVEAGRASLPNGTGRHPSFTSATKVDPLEVRSNAGTPRMGEIRETPQSERRRYVPGRYYPEDKDEELRSPGSGRSKPSRAFGLPNGNSLTERSVSELVDDGEELPSVAHRTIQYMRADTSQQGGSTTGYAFIKDSARHKPTAEVLAADLDFGKFVKTLRRELGFEQGRESLICRIGDGETDVASERTWYHVLKEWEGRMSLAPLVFEVMGMHRSPQAQAKVGASKQQTTDGDNGIATNSNANGLQKLQLQRSAPTKKKKGVCICGKPAEGGRGCIACDNHECERGTFHVSCAGVDKRTLGWRCAECSAS